MTNELFRRFGNWNGKQASTTEQVQVSNVSLSLLTRFADWPILFQKKKKKIWNSWLPDTHANKWLMSRLGVLEMER